MPSIDLSPENNINVLQSWILEIPLDYSPSHLNSSVVDKCFIREKKPKSSLHVCMKNNVSSIPVRSQWTIPSDASTNETCTQAKASWMKK